MKRKHVEAIHTTIEVSLLKMRPPSGACGSPLIVCINIDGVAATPIAASRGSSDNAKICVAESCD